MFQSVNPANGKVLQNHVPQGVEELYHILESSYRSWSNWKKVSIEERSALVKNFADILSEYSNEAAELISLEMGKPINESISEINKCIWLSDYFTDNIKALLKEETIPTEAQNSFIQFEPLGPLFAIMPWNFPFWQVLRFAIPTILGGNAVILKHAPNVFGCGKKIQELFSRAGFPDFVFTSVVTNIEGTEQIIANHRIQGVTLTGSTNAGRAVASLAGKHLKKCVLELGGSDPFIVLKDADLKKAAEAATVSRMSNAGQVCIAAKRIIVQKQVLNEFLELHIKRLKALKIGDPLSQSTDMGPLAREDLRSQLQKQIAVSEKMGANLIYGGREITGKGFFMEPGVLTNVTPDMPAFLEETFGPLSVIITVDNEDHAVEVANNSIYGLGASIWSSDLDKARKLAFRLEVGAVFINSMTRSDPRLPFGGVKQSGFGNELSVYGLKEFMNIKPIWIH